MDNNLPEIDEIELAPPSRNKKVKYPKLAKWLKKKYIDYFKKSSGYKKQRQLAEELGISETQVSKYMSGSTMPTDAVIHRMADVLGMGVYLATDTPPHLPITDPEVLQFLDDHVELVKKIPDLLNLLIEVPDLAKVLKDPAFREILQGWGEANNDIKFMLRDKMREMTAQKKGGINHTNPLITES